MEERMKIINVRLTTLGVDCSSPAVDGIALQPPNCWDLGFEFRRGMDVCLLWVGCFVR